MEQPQIRGFSDWRVLTYGAVAEVWEARQLSLDRRVVVKTYRRERAEADHRFVRELVAAGRLSSHPGIITVHDAGILPDERLYLIMEFCPGGSSSQWLDPQNRLSEERVRRVGVQMADALAAAHSAGVVHGNVMPANILIDSYGNARLADFGLAVIGGSEIDDADVPPVLSDFAAPEASDRQPATEFGDVFSLAATLYALLTGEPPPRVRAPAGAAQAVSERLIDPLSAVDESWVDVLARALEIDPAARPTAAQFRDQLMKISFVGASGPRLTVDQPRGMPSASGGGADWSAVRHREDARRGGIWGWPWHCGSDLPGGSTRSRSTPSMGTASCWRTGSGRGFGRRGRIRRDVADYRVRNQQRSPRGTGSDGGVLARRWFRPFHARLPSSWWQSDRLDFDSDEGGDPAGEFCVVHQTFPGRTVPRDVSRWSRSIPSRAALGGRKVDLLSLAGQDRPVRRIHYLRRAVQVGSLPASGGGFRVRPDLRSFGLGRQGLRASGAHLSRSRTDDSWAKTTTLSRYLCLAWS